MRRAGADCWKFGQSPPRPGWRLSKRIEGRHGCVWERGSKDTANGRWKAPHYTGLGYLIRGQRLRDTTGDGPATDEALAALNVFKESGASLGFKNQNLTQEMVFQSVAK